MSHSLRGEGFDASEDGTGRGTPIVPARFPNIVCKHCGEEFYSEDEIGGLAPAECPSCGNESKKTMIAFSCKDHGADASNDVAPTMRSMGHDKSHANAGGQLAVAFQTHGSNIEHSGDVSGTLQTNSDRASGSDPMVAQAVCFQSEASASQSMNPATIAPTLDKSKSEGLAVAFDLRGREGGAQFEGPHDTANIRAASGGSSRSYVAQQWAVRRLLVEECEKLQGFPVGWTDVPGSDGKLQADGPRYKQLGNSMAVNVVRWIGKRIDAALRKDGA